MSAYPIFIGNTDRDTQLWIKDNPPPRGKVWKTDGNSNLILVDDPDYLTDDGKFKKSRKKITNFKPKKKRRK